MEILLIRHGESEADLRNVHEGRADFHLTAEGLEQAQLLAKWVTTNYPPEFIWSSPLRRAIQVADVLSSTLSISLQTHDGLMEWNNGVLAGMDREEALRVYPEPVGGRKPHEAVPSGESPLEFRGRVEICFSEIISRSSTFHRIAVISHGGTISHLIASFLGLPMVSQCRFATGNTGCHLLTLNGAERSIRFMNRQDHLFPTVH